MAARSPSTFYPSASSSLTATLGPIDSSHERSNSVELQIFNRVSHCVPTFATFCSRGRDAEGRLKKTLRLVKTTSLLCTSRLYGVQGMKQKRLTW